MAKRFAGILAAFLAIAVAFSVTGCSKKDVAAIVNGDPIKKTDIDAQMAQVEKAYPNLFQGADGQQRKDEFRQRLLDQAINNLLITQEAKRQGVDVSDADINKEIENLKKGFPNEAGFTEALSKNGLTLDELKKRERENMTSQKLVDKITKDVAVSDAEMKDYYDKNKSVFTEKAGVHAAHILFDEKDKATAEKVLAEVKAGGDFAELAKKNSKDPGSAAKGGDLGWPTTPYVPEFQKALDGAQPGQLVPELVKTQYGYHIIKVIEKRGETVKKFDDVKTEVKQILQQQKKADAFQKLLDELKKKAKIEYPNGQPAGVSTVPQQTPQKSAPATSGK